MKASMEAKDVHNAFRSMLSITTIDKWWDVNCFKKDRRNILISSIIFSVNENDLCISLGLHIIIFNIPKYETLFIRVKWETHYISRFLKNLVLPQFTQHCPIQIRHRNILFCFVLIISFATINENKRYVGIIFSLCKTIW